MQVDPEKPTLKVSVIKCSKLKCDEPPSKFAFKLNLRRYSKGAILDVTTYGTAKQMFSATSSTAFLRILRV